MILFLFHIGLMDTENIDLLEIFWQKKLIKKSGYKKSLKIARYEVWGTLRAPNYYEDITDFIDKKRELIECYESRKKHVMRIEF